MIADKGQNSGRQRLGKEIWKQKYLLIFIIPAIIWMIIFCYYPLYGITIAFKDYNFGLGIFKSPWVGMKYFKEIYNDPYFLAALWNTLRISLLKLVFGFPVPVLFALMLNELRGMTLFKKGVQTFTYLPHFLSWAFLANFLSMFLSDSGMLNKMLINLNILSDPKAFLGEPTSFLVSMVVSDIWKSFGFSSIIYLAAISSVDMEQYEAAIIDGASRMRQIWHITLPAIKPTIAILLILQISGLMNANFEQMFLMKNSLVKDVAEILGTYTYDIGIKNGRFSYSSAVGLFTSLVSFILLYIANTVTKKSSGESLF